jgi:hypothetical protein
MRAFMNRVIAAGIQQFLITVTHFKIKMARQITRKEARDVKKKQK